ncbi:MAG: hypothetical protein QXW97_04320 [Candidatus Pacearchaeota archaeon]
MKDKTILKLSIIISIVGIFTLLLLSINLEPKLIKIKDINSLDLYKKIKVQGKIVSIKKLNNLDIIKIEDGENKINVLVYNSKINFEINRTVIVIGKIVEYKNNLEIAADKIKYQ